MKTCTDVKNINLIVYNSHIYLYLISWHTEKSMWYGTCFISTIAMKYLQLPIKAKQLVEQVNWTGSSALLALASLIFILTIDFLWGLIKHSDLMVIISGNFCSVGRCHVLLGNQIGTTLDLKQHPFCAFLVFH